jgi:hypothetical protein
MLCFALRGVGRIVSWERRENPETVNKESGECTRAPQCV